jgi:predicted dienelactone hydrolase
MAQDAVQLTRSARFRVGYTVLDIGRQRNGSPETLTVAVWYPTSQEQDLHDPGIATTGNGVALEGEPPARGGPYPLLAFSHGYGGSGLGAQFLASQLTKLGWIVVAPDHHDKYSAFRIRSGRQDVNPFDLTRQSNDIRKADADPIRRQMHYLYRLEDMKFTLDELVASADWSQLIDKDRIAICGHSSGGFSALGLCGTIEQYHDLRIKAMLLFSRGAFGQLSGENLFEADELSAVTIPSMILVGEQDVADQRGTKSVSELAGDLYAKLNAPKYLLMVNDAGRLSVNDFRDLYDFLISQVETEDVRSV